jgi:hypothetical protein
MITEKQWQKIEGKYGMLMSKISHQITGDRSTSSYDDNMQDIRMAALDAVSGFERQRNGENGTFDDFWGTVGFDKYIKTCMWTKKNNKGAKITKRYKITRDVATVESEEALHIVGMTGQGIENSIFFDEICDVLSEGEAAALSIILKDHTMVKAGGRVNISKLSEEMGLSWLEGQKLVLGLGNKIGNEL